MTFSASADLCVKANGKCVKKGKACGAGLIEDKNLKCQGKATGRKCCKPGKVYIFFLNSFRD